MGYRFATILGRSRKERRAPMSMLMALDTLLRVLILDCRLTMLDRRQLLRFCYRLERRVVPPTMQGHRSYGVPAATSHRMVPLRVWTFAWRSMPGAPTVCCPESFLPLSAPVAPTNSNLPASLRCRS